MRVVPVVVAAVAVSTTLLAGPAVAAKPTAKPGKQSAQIGRMPTTVVASPDDEYITVPVRYRCSDTARTKHYLSGLITQEGSPHYVFGYRGDSGTVAATCTGKWESQDLRFQISSYAFEPHEGAHSGPADLEFAIEPRGVPGAGGPGWYEITGPFTVRVSTVTVIAE